MQSAPSFVSVSSTTSSAAWDAAAEQAFDSAPGDACEHVVMPGDTLAGICLRYGVSERALRRANGIESLAQATTLKLPRPRAGRPRRAAQPQTRDARAGAMLGRASRGGLLVHL